MNDDILEYTKYRKYYDGDKKLFVQNHLHEMMREIGNEILNKEEYKNILHDRGYKKYSDERMLDGEIEVFLGKEAFRLIQEYYTITIEKVIREAWIQAVFNGDIMLDEIHMLYALHKFGRDYLKTNGVEL